MIETPLRKRIDISDDWEFVRGRVGRRWMQGRKKGGEIVDLPHCWNRTDTYQHGRRSYSGRGAYRRIVDLPEAPEGSGSWRLRSGGFYGFGDIWLDGRSIARFDGQYLGFDKALPESITSGEHVVTLRLDSAGVAATVLFRDGPLRVPLGDSDRQIPAPATDLAAFGHALGRFVNFKI